jgi:putative transposase
MARPLRVDVKDGWYHITARGTERRTIFQGAREYEHFLDLLEAMAERYAVKVHAYALMGNHYHLLIQTPQANASAAVQWLNVSYSVWFNRRRDRVGHVFQGRFGSVLIDGDGTWALNASVYVHLNPIHIKAQGLGKSANRAEAKGFKAPSREEIRSRLAALRAFRWSSYRAYAGYAAAPAWLCTEELTRRAGGRAQYRRYVHAHVRRGAKPEGYEDLQGRLVLGAREFVEQAKRWVRRVSHEQPARRQLARAIPLDAIVRAAEHARGAKWEQFCGRYGDWGRELALYVARKRSGLTLRQIGAALGGLEYKTVGKAVQRFEVALAKDVTRRRALERCLAELSIVDPDCLDGEELHVVKTAWIASVLA